MKQRLSMLWVFLLSFVVGAWAGDVMTLTLNGSEVSDPVDFFSHDTSGKFGFNNKFTGATYDGIEFTSGLKLESTTKILFTTAMDATVTIVQSTWSDKGITFDGKEIASSTATAGTGCRIYTISDVAAGEHNIMRAGGESGLFYVKVEYSGTDTSPKLNVSPASLSFSLNPAKQEETQTFTITGKNLTDGIYDIVLPNLAGLSVNPGSFEVSGGVANQEIAVTYASSTDVAKAETTIGVAVGELSANVAVTYQSRAEAYTQSTVSADAVWDWSQLSETVELTETSIPSKADEFLLADLDDRINFTEQAFGDAKAIKMQNIQYPSRGGYAQGTYIKFKTSVPGTLAVDFSNTGKNRPDRILYVNGVATEFKSNTSDVVSATGIKVPAGEVVLNGVLDPDAATNYSDYKEETHGVAGAPNQFRWYKIYFVADQTYPITVSVEPEGAATVTLNKTEAAEGETVELKNVVLAAGYDEQSFDATNFSIVTAGGTEVAWSNDGAFEQGVPAFKFTMPAEPVFINLSFYQEPEAGTKVTFDFTANKWNHPVGGSATADPSPVLSDGISEDGINLLFKQGAGNAPYYYSNSFTGALQARMLKGNVLKVYAPEGKTIKKVVFTTASAATTNLAAESGLSEDKLTWTGNATYAKFTSPNGSSYITKMDVTYDEMDSETVVPEEADETIFLSFDDGLIHSEFATTESYNLESDITVVDGHRDADDKIDGETLVKTTIPASEATAQSKNRINYGTRSGVYTVSARVFNGTLTFKTDPDKVIKTIKMDVGNTFDADNINGQPVTRDEILAGVTVNSNEVTMPIKSQSIIYSITYTVGDKPAEVVKYPIEAVVTPAEALTFDYNPKEAAAGEEVTVALSNPVFGEGYSSADLLTATRSLKTESGTDVEYTLDPLTWSIKFTMPEEKVIASFEFAEKAKEYEDIVVVPAEGADIYEAVQTASEGKNVRNITVYLEPGKQFTVSQTIVAPAAFAIIGAAEGTDPSTIDWTATMAEIDASALTGPMVQMSEEPAVEADANGFYPIEDAGFINVKVTGLTQQLFYANRQKYLINSFHVNFCNINVAGGTKTIIDTNSGGVIAELDMSKNTIWAEPANTGALYSSQSGQKATDAGLAEQVFNIEKNTFYNIAYGKNVNTHRQSNQTWLTYNVNKNVFINTGKSGQAIKGINQGQGGSNPTWAVIGNVFNFDGADTSEAESTGDADEPVQNSLAGVFAFTDAATGDFNGVFKGQAAEAPAQYPGDPRWSYTYEIAPTDIVINPEDITDGDISAAFAAKTEGVAKIGNVSINLDGATNYTVAAPIVVPGTVEIVGNGATIDASGMTGNGIVQYVPYEAPADATPETPVVWTEANVSFSGLTVKGLNKALFYSNSKNYYASSFIIDNCVIEQAGDATTIDYTKGSVALNFIVQNSTIYAPTATTKSFYSSQGGQKATEYDANATQAFTFQSNTLYNLAPGKNLFTHRQNSQKWLAYTIADNVIVNCGKSGQAVKSFNGGGVSSNPTWAVIGNVFNFNGADTSDAESTGDDTEGETVMNSYTGVVTFTDAATGDFSGTFAYTGEAPASLTAGDPRWTLTIEEATPTGINGASLNDNVEMINDKAPAYNLAGQKVGKNYKGIVIKNGRKVVMK